LTGIGFGDEFSSNVDEFIRSANKLVRNIDNEKLAAALNLAASRYCAYTAASNSQDNNKFKELKNEAIEYFLFNI